MGLILGARSSFFRVHSLWKAEMVLEGRNAHSGSFLMERSVPALRVVVSDALSKELDSSSCDDHQIESSTDVCPCKKRCHFLMTQIALWYLMNFWRIFLFFTVKPRERILLFTPT